MCCKCLYGILSIIFCILIYFFIPTEDLASWITALSTLAMAIFAYMALNSWKNQQKREKLIVLLETLNEYMQELKYYELKSTIFSKTARKNHDEDFSNNDLIEKQAKIIDIELAESDGKNGLCFKNWLIDHEEQKIYIDNIMKILQKYRLEVFIFTESKISFYLKKNQPENVLYEDYDIKELADRIRNKHSDFVTLHDKLIEEINKFKLLNKKLLK